MSAENKVSSQQTDNAIGGHNDNDNLNQTLVESDNATIQHSNLYEKGHSRMESDKRGEILKKRMQEQILKIEVCNLMTKFKQ